MAGLAVTATDGSGLEAYLAAPSTGSGPGLVLFPENSGADPDAHEIADLFAGALWEQHTRYEFATRDVAATMVAEP
jgi:dienelactone hydrolase